jgi:hypothetical protein
LVSRFFETEGIAILTMLVYRYKIKVKEEPKFANETFEQRRERVLACKPGLTLTCVSWLSLPCLTDLHFAVPFEFLLYLKEGIEIIVTGPYEVQKGKFSWDESWKHDYEIYNRNEYILFF